MDGLSPSPPPPPLHPETSSDTTGPRSPGESDHNVDSDRGGVMVVKTPRGMSFMRPRGADESDRGG